MMNMMKKRKRLTVVVLAFMMVFLVGAAFAAGGGLLTIDGTVTVGEPELNVRWASSSVTTGYDGDAESDAIIGSGVQASRITWSVHLAGDGVAMLSAQAENVGGLPAYITFTGYEWTYGLAEATDLGLVVNIDYDDFIGGPLAVRELTGEVIVTLTWDGIDADDVLAGYEYVELELEITFEYELYTP